jgi:hypothetical protein
LLQALLFFGICPNTLSDCDFARYHYNFVTHLSEHTVVPKTESLTLLFEMTGFDKNVPKFLFLAMQCPVCSSKDTIGQCVLANDTK